MQNRIECIFTSDAHRHCPYVKELYLYDLTNGTMEYDGNFYITDEELPIKLRMWLHKLEKEPFQVVENTSYYHYEMNESYEIEIYKHEQREDTSVLSEITDEDGTPMSVCFFPSYRHKLWFTIQKATDCT